MEKLTIVIPNRNRDLKIVKQSLKSIHPQLIDHVTITLVDYGSALSYQRQLKEVIDGFKGIELIICPVQGQLWNKSRCINLILKNTTAKHLMVSDMDLIWHPDFLETMLPQLDNKSTSYFPVGFMSQEESVKDVSFHQRTIKFMSNEEATGISIFPVHQLLEINGFDEFYHGWGSEDTDVHVRLKKAGFEVRFRESEVLFKHQWHAKFYRNKSSTEPFHGALEKINQQYLLLTRKIEFPTYNQINDKKWGVLPVPETYDKLEHPDLFLNVYHVHADLMAMLFKLRSIQRICVSVTVKHHSKKGSLKTKLKKILGKKIINFISASISNELILELLIDRFRNCPYKYQFNRETGEIKLVINIID
ncbi:glycosyltransferase [Nonlabens mediterrranea]|uniref:Glycosyltransferase n=1 Tax=Nonlabens mediterrranea TaxID=1419947 RepID=A0ABS0A7T4_9FLAO|nr:glycosyltransferase [Nonlabens mediterrranea]